MVEDAVLLESTAHNLFGTGLWEQFAVACISRALNLNQFLLVDLQRVLQDTSSSMTIEAIAVGPKGANAAAQRENVRIRVRGCNLPVTIQSSTRSS